MNYLLHSRKFWLAVLDVVVSTATYFVGKYVPTGNSEDIIWLIASWQPVVVALIVGIAYEDGKLGR